MRARLSAFALFLLLVPSVPAQVTSFNGRTGVVLPATNDYSVIQLKNIPFRSAPDYNFVAQSPGGSLTGGIANTVTLTPCPPGVNGLDSKHFLYVSGGVGTAEAVLIAGGTCTAGAASGTVVFTPSSNHSGAWTIASATAGIQEMLQALATAGGGVGYLPTGTYNLRATLTIPAANVQLVGSGRGASILFVPNSVFSVSTSGPFWVNPFYAAVTALTGISKVAIRDLTVNMNGANNSVAATNFVYAVAWKDVNDSQIDNIEVINPIILTGGTTFISIATTGTSARNVVSNSLVANRVCSVSGEGEGGFWTSGANNVYINDSVTNGCNSVFVAGINTFSSTCSGNSFINPTFDLAGSTQVQGSQAMLSDNCQGLTIEHGKCKGNGTGPTCFASTTDSVGSDSLDLHITDPYAINCGVGVGLNGANGQFTRYVSVIGGSVNGCAKGVSLGDNLQGVLIEGMQLTNNTTVGIESAPTTAAGQQGINVRNNIIKNAMGAGITTASASANIDIEMNDLTAAASNPLVDNSTQTTVKIVNNYGYNPQGPASITVTASPFTYSAGHTSEDISIAGGTVSSVAINSVNFCTSAPCFVHLAPNQQVVVTYSVAPTMRKNRL
jgi:hypothetical protein